MEHLPVLPDAVVDALARDRSGFYVDGTFGRGGHSRRLLERLASDAGLLAIDADEDACRAARDLARTDSRVRVVRGRFGDLARHLAGVPAAAGVMLDVGVSSPQLDDPARGFSFLRDGPLDMRMDRSGGPTAAAWLDAATEEEIADVLRRFGEERHSRRIARRIVAERPIRTTGELAAVVARAMPAAGARQRGRHAATRVFQAIRIRVNDELGELDRGLDAAFDALAPCGRLAVLTFHSLEHRMVRQRFRDWTRGAPVPRRMPVADPAAPIARQVQRALRPGAEEVAANPRARSAMLQVVEKSPTPAPEGGR